jgi:hypothetical protein
MQGLKMAVQCVRTNRLDHAGELMPQDERRLQRCVADPGILVGVQIAAADSHCGYAQQRLAGAGWTWTWHLFHAQVGRAVEPSGEHRGVRHVTISLS